MDTVTEIANRRRIGRRVVLGVVIAAALALLLVVYQVDRSPRTDDANVWANYIEIAPEVSGRLVELPIKDNAFVKKGDLLFVIDPRPYEYALQQALSDQRALEEQIIDERRRISAQNSAVQAAGAAVSTSKTGIQTAGSNIDAARAAVTRAQAAATAAEAQLRLDTNNYHRIEPLLQKQYVTVEQVDQANTAVHVAQGNYDEAQAALLQARAQLSQATLHQEEANSQSAEYQAKLGQAIHAIDRVETPESQRPARAAKVDSARLDLERTRVVAPFDAYVTSMNISVGAYAHPGHAPVHPHRHTRLVRHRQLPRVQAQEHPHWGACRCLPHGPSRPPLQRPRREPRLRSPARRRACSPTACPTSSAHSTGYTSLLAFRFAYASKIPTRYSSASARPLSRL